MSDEVGVAMPGPGPAPMEALQAYSDDEEEQGPAGMGMPKAVVCNLLGVVPHEPVISPQGYVFEKTAIESYLENTGKFCPITREALRPEDCMKMNVLPTQTPMIPLPNSIPNLIGLLKNDVDTVFMENFKVREESKSLKEELSTTLYTEDAAVRILIKYQKEIEMLKERNQQLVEANARVSSMQPNQFANGVAAPGAPGVANGGAGTLLPGELPSGPSAELLNEFFEAENVFKEERKAKKNKVEGLNPDIVKSLSSTAKIPLHSTTAKGIRCCALQPEDDKCIITGGVDGSIIVFHREKRRQVDQMKLQMKDPKPVSALAVKGNIIVAGASDGQISIFEANLGEWERGYLKTSSLKHHKKEITSIAIHPKLDYILACSKDKSYSLFATDGTLVFHNKGKHEATNSHTEFSKKEFSAMALHPGGGILAFATTACDLELWSFKSMSAPISEASDVHIYTEDARRAHDNEPIKKLYFPSDCLTMASVSANYLVLWKLKGNSVKQKISLPKINNVQFDASGKWIAICNEALHLYYREGKGDFDIFKTLTDHSDAVMDCAFSDQIVCSVSMDRNLEVYEEKN